MQPWCRCDRESGRGGKVGRVRGVASEVGGKPAEYGAHTPNRIRQDLSLLGCKENCKAAGAQGRQA